MVNWNNAPDFIEEKENIECSRLQRGMLIPACPKCSFPVIWDCSCEKEEYTYGESSESLSNFV